jgi:D-proline reductase (dithiol) PrdB
VPRLDRLPQVTRTKLLTRPVEIHHDSPFTPLATPLSEARLAIVTTAGLHLRGDEPFSADDGSFRVIPSSAGEADLVQSHTSIGFERASQARDINVVFPLDRLRELVERGELGAVAANHYSLLGAQHDSTIPAKVSGAEIAARLLGEVDVVLLTPT